MTAPMTTQPADADEARSPTFDRDALVAELERARARTLALCETVDDATLCIQISPLMSPIVWDLAHIGNYEDQWLVRALGAEATGDPSLDELYDAFRHPRADRPALPILGPDEARAYDERVRSRTLDILHSTSERADDRLVAGGFVYGMVVQHEHQHDETILATLQLLDEDAPTPPVVDERAPDAAIDVDALPEMCRIAGGPTVVGTAGHPWAYDNEQPAHEVDVAPFLIDTTAVTNRAYRAFILDGGYDDERLWNPQGWVWRQEADLTEPEFWVREGPRDFAVLRFGEWLDLVDILDQPVQHVCWYEADAFARWTAKRLPTETEWEVAAGAPERWPWGAADPTTDHANLGQRHMGPGSVAAHPDGAGPYGTLGMIGDVWEWTSSTFQPYPGFEAYPYREYSEVFWGSDYRVLKGGSWATDATAVRVGFRNWDFPIRRQIFAGFRCARDDD